VTVPGHDAGVLAIVPSATLLGLDGRFIRVEVDVAPPSPEREWDVFLTNASADKATASELAADVSCSEGWIWYRIPDSQGTSHASQPRSPSTKKRRMRRMRHTRQEE